MQQSLNTTHVLGAAASGLTLISTMNPTMPLLLADQGQTVSYLQFVNRPNALGMDQQLNSFYQSNPSTLINNPAQNWFQGPSSTALPGGVSGLRQLQAQNASSIVQSQVNELSVNPKIYMKGYGNYFLINAFMLIVMNVLAWILALCFRIASNYWTSKYGQYVCYFFCDNLAVVVFFLTASEMTLLSFFQTQQMAWGTNLEIASSSLAIVFMIYYLGFFLYMIYLVVENKIYNDPVYKNRLAILIQPFKNKNLSQRLFPSMYLLRKFVSSAILVYLYNYPTVQGLLVAVVYFLFWVYMFLNNPINNSPLKVFITFVESEMCLLHIIYFFVLASSMEGDVASEVSLTKWVSYVIMLQMGTYALFALGFSCLAI
jgi:hypothetical protein